MNKIQRARVFIRFCGLLLLGLLAHSSPAATPTSSTPAEEVRHSVEYTDTDIRTILREVSDLYDVPLIIPESLQGRATIKLRNVGWQQLFKTILEPIGYTYEWDGKVATVESLKKDPPRGDFPTADMLSAFTAVQTAVAKEMLRDQDMVEALADFHWNLYSALLRKGFTKEQAILIVVSAEPASVGSSMTR
jgi:type II secretory pathway component GspD/PulD (secretin)